MSEPTGKAGVLKLYIHGDAPTSEQAVRSVRTVCEEDFEGEFVLQVVDVSDPPETQDQGVPDVWATPALLVEAGDDRHALLVGDFSAPSRVRRALALRDVV